MRCASSLQRRFFATATEVDPRIRLYQSKGIRIAGGDYRIPDLMVVYGDGRTQVFEIGQLGSTRAAALQGVVDELVRVARGRPFSFQPLPHGGRCKGTTQNAKPCMRRSAGNYGFCSVHR